MTCRHTLFVCGLRFSACHFFAWQEALCEALYELDPGGISFVAAHGVCLSICLDIYITHCVGYMGWFVIWSWIEISCDLIWMCSLLYPHAFWIMSIAVSSSPTPALKVLTVESIYRSWDRALKARFDELDLPFQPAIPSPELPAVFSSPPLPSATCIMLITLHNALPICSSSLCNHAWHNALQFDYALCFQMFSFIHIIADTKISLPVFF